MLILSSLYSFSSASLLLIETFIILKFECSIMNESSLDGKITTLQENVKEFGKKAVIYGATFAGTSIAGAEMIAYLYDFGNPAATAASIAAKVDPVTGLIVWLGSLVSILTAYVTFLASIGYATKMSYAKDELSALLSEQKNL